MRDILFKGKAKYENGSIKKGDWVYGDLIRVNGITKIYNDKLGYVEVNPETVGQFTGLCDKNGKRIFEGDILKYIDEDEEPHYITVVYEDCAFLIEDCGIIEPELLTSYECLELELAGNIFDNSDLLEVQI